MAVAGLAARLGPRLALRDIAREAALLARLGERLRRAGRRQVAEADGRLTALAKLLRSLSYERVLERGFAVVREAGGAIVESADATLAGQHLALQFRDGGVPVTVDAASAAEGRERKPRAAPTTSRQGSLL